MDDDFNVEGDAASLTGRIRTSLDGAGLRTNQIESGIRAHAGSDFLFRLLGIPLGSSQLPVGIDVRLTSVGDDTRVSATAYDRLGWYFDKKLFWGEEVVDRKLTGLLNMVRSAADQPMLPERKATFNP
ncbi:hypothetical protein V3C33_04820 [Micrococcaceae bacterium Sec5.7]